MKRKHGVGQSQFKTPRQITLKSWSRVSTAMRQLLKGRTHNNSQMCYLGAIWKSIRLIVVFGCGNYLKTVLAPQTLLHGFWKLFWAGWEPIKWFIKIESDHAKHVYKLHKIFKKNKYLFICFMRVWGIKKPNIDTKS